MSKGFKELTREEVQQRVIIDAKFYDLSRFADLHPGGRAVAGEDATEAFYGLHRHDVLERPQYARLQIGVLRGEHSVITGRLVGGLSSVPFVEPTFLTKGFHSTYCTENYKAFQKAVRKFFDEVVYPDAQEREIEGKRPSQEVFDKMAEAHLNVMQLGPGKHLKGLSLFHGLVKPEEVGLILSPQMDLSSVYRLRRQFDYFHESFPALLGGKVIGLPPVLNFGSPEIKAKGRAGSGVLGMKTTAVKSEDGKFWIINGEKKWIWITNGHFTTGCRTKNGLTAILIPRKEGVTTTPIKTSYSPTTAAAYVTFDSVRVPVENTLGHEGGEIFVILSIFNHERWVMVCASARAQRLIVEECLKWVSQRKAFGKPLSSQVVVRAKLAAMIARSEASYKEQATNLADQIAFLKMYNTRWHGARRIRQEMRCRSLGGAASRRREWAASSNLRVVS
ncbi:peroxisomal acyl-CoA-dehydrogenase [Russula emetica]|nr:peroxisomal acyl-CoA-dehydrogenase [Russula emetica]